MTRKKAIDVANDPIHSVAATARALGVSIHAMRIYEREGLLLPARDAAKHRRYSDVEMRKIDGIRNFLRGLRMNFEAVRRMIALIPCHRMHQDCTRTMRASCEFYQHKDRPCWTYRNPCQGDAGEAACRECRVYTEALEYGDVLRMIKA